MKTRLQYIVNQEGLSNNRFATEIGVSPAAVTHIISGRNNPSLDIIAKIASKYPKYSLRWLILGELPILNNTSDNVAKIAVSSTSQTTLPFEQEISDNAPAEESAEQINKTSTHGNTTGNITSSTHEESSTITLTPSHQDRLIVCLPDGTFQEFTRRK